MALTIKNNSKKDVVIQHFSGQKYDFVLLDDKKEELYRWSGDRAFVEILTSTEIPAGKTVEFRKFLMQRLTMKSAARHIILKP